MLGECDRYATCTNNTQCYYCNDMSLYREKGQKKGQRNTDLFKQQDKKVALSDNSWEDLEQQVADSLNKIPNIQEARRSRASGALWFEKGDIQDAILHPECKERTAEKSFSVKREWLEKAAEECKMSEKTMCLPFRFKGDDKIYCIFEQNDIAQLITMMKAYMLDNDRMRKELETLKKGVK